jgi:hypothetical protein
MRFGIITMQRDALIPTGMSMEEALASLEVIRARRPDVLAGRVGTG